MNVRTKVPIGIVLSAPVLDVSGVMLRYWGDGVWFNALCTRGSKSDHSSEWRLRSDVAAWRTRRISLPRRSIKPLIEGEKGKVKWCLTRYEFWINYIVSFWKCVCPSKIQLFGMRNTAHRSTKPARVMRVAVERNKKHYLSAKWSLRISSICLLPLFFGTIST